MTDAEKQICCKCGNDTFLVYEFQTELTCDNAIALVCSKCGEEAAAWCNNQGEVFTGLKSKEKEE